MEQSRSVEADIRSDGYAVFRLLCKPMVHYLVHKIRHWIYLKTLESIPHTPNVHLKCRGVLGCDAV